MNKATINKVKLTQNITIERFIQFNSTKDAVDFLHTGKLPDKNDGYGIYISVYGDGYGRCDSVITDYDLGYNGKDITLTPEQLIEFNMGLVNFENNIKTDNKKIQYEDIPRLFVNTIPEKCTATEVVNLWNFCVKHKLDPKSFEKEN